MNLIGFAHTYKLVDHDELRRCAFVFPFSFAKMWFPSLSDVCRLLHRAHY